MNQQNTDTHNRLTAESEGDSADLQALERGARLRWVSLIVGLLSLQVAIGVAAIFLSVGDPSVAIVPNYHQAALDWDMTRRAEQLPGKLGWQIDSAVGPVEPSTGERSVIVSILNRNGKPVEGVNVSGQVYHYARANDAAAVVFKEIDAGRYMASTSLSRAGLWQVKLKIEGDHGIAAVRSDVEVN